MNPISYVKLFRAGRLPDLDEPIVIVTFEQTREDFFFAEFFIVYGESERPHGRRYLCKGEDAQRYVEIRPPEKIADDVAEDARREIEGKLIESLTEEQQHRWILGPAYTLTSINLDDLRALWVRGRIEHPLREIEAFTRSMELKAELNKILRLRHWKYTKIDPFSPE